MMTGKTYYIHEMYPCLQGEGRNLGKPSLLIRFQRCNLRCKWCDTRYAISDTKEINNNQNWRELEMTLSDVIQQIKSYPSLQHIMFTGGEPTLQNFNQIFKVLESNYTAEVESNATIIPHKIHKDFKIEDYNRYQWNLSPKGNNAGQNVNSDALDFWAELSKKHDKVFFKFVIAKESSHKDLNEVLEIIEGKKIKHDRVYLMPEGTTLESQVYNEWLAEICLRYNFNYTPRMQIILFNNRKGV